jgi:glycosyltransferase involved in cell wall biosynthesis
MKILILSEYFPLSDKADITGGVEARAYNVAKYLARKHNVKIITSWKKGQKREDRFSNFEVFRVGSHHEYSHSGSFLSRLKLVKAAVKKGVELDIDIVDGYSYLMYLASYKIAKKKKIPSVITYHETWLGNWIKNKGIITGIPGEIWERFALTKRYEKIISVSKFTKKNLEKFGKKNVDVVHNGVDLRYFSKIKAKKYKEPTICCINRLTPKKRVGDVIQALSIIRTEIPNIKCKIIGKGDEINSLKNMVKNLRLEDNVDFLGFVEKNEDVIKTLKSSHLFCSASILEGFGMVLVEAMASNIPYVCSDIEPFKEVTEKGKGGLIFKAKNYSDLAIKLKLLLKNKKLYNQKIKEEKFLVRKYDWENIANQIEEIYKKLVS